MLLVHHDKPQIPKGGKDRRASADHQRNGPCAYPQPALQAFAIGKTVFKLARTRDITRQVAAELTDDLKRKSHGAVVDRTYVEALSLEMQKDDTKKKGGLFSFLFGRGK